MFNINIFKERIQELCKQTGISQKHICDILNRKRTYLNEVWRNNAAITNTELTIIAAELGTTPEYLKGEVDTPEQDESYIAEIKKSPAKQDLMKAISKMSDEDALTVANLINRLMNGAD